MKNEKTMEDKTIVKHESVAGNESSMKQEKAVMENGKATMEYEKATKECEKAAMEHGKAVIEQLRDGQIKSQKRGIHFILASIVLWCGITVVGMSDFPVLTKNMITFCLSAPLMPLALLFSKMLGITFNDKKNPLNFLGILFALAQMPYLLIVMWAYSKMPNQMVMLYAMITGAHFLPYGWLYKSKVYYIYAVIIPVVELVLGCTANAWITALGMVILEITLLAALLWENR